MLSASGPAGRAGLRTPLVVAIAAVDRLATHRGERNFGGHATAVACDADHRALASAAVSIPGSLAFVAAGLASLRFVCETTLCVKRLFILAEHELLSAISAIEILVVECIHEPMIS